jgi:hypothetical protein
MGYETHCQMNIHNLGTMKHKYMQMKNSNNNFTDTNIAVTSFYFY